MRHRALTTCLVISTTLLLVMLAGSAPRAEAQPQGAAGRFALVSAEFTVTSEGGAARQVTGLFKLDTATGNVWRYTEHVRKDGDVRTRWISTDGQN